ncbi:response regulator [Fulvivirgaceae bacterium PWU4]|uniref:Response regulator n=1 Tax=Chryseosolibacter histidini TaxID=2782349 RepID=A0AAP2DGZ0_9BACT|nr:response regulator [Chryseosolibacter histidini]MBT1695419.1 response regulator [Chryseosolibacter histidini]
MKKILLADDDSDDAEIFQEALQYACPSALFMRFEDGKQLLQHLETNLSSLPDLIFLDLNMPEMNGWQCLAALKTNHKLKSIPVIIYTTSSNPRDKEIAIDLNAHGLIVKPSNQKALERILSIVVCKLGSHDLEHAINDAYLLSKEN